MTSMEILRLGAAFTAMFMQYLFIQTDNINDFYISFIALVVEQLADSL
jgi:hypothetical protein